MLAYQPRRSVPWGIVDVAALAVVFFVVPGLVAQAALEWRGRAAVAAPQAAEAGPTNEHPLARVLLESRDPWEIFVCAVAAVVVAPVVEELLFRLVLQGWLEALERRVRRRIRWPAPRELGVLPVGLTSLGFAAMHVRSPQPAQDVSTLVLLLGAGAAASTLAAIFSVGWLRLASGATAADFGVDRRRLVADLRLGGLAFLVVIVPIYGVYFVAGLALPPRSLLPELAAIFTLSLALGTLYYRTHRIAPCIALHSAFNAAAVGLALLAL